MDVDAMMMPPPPPPPRMYRQQQHMGTFIGGNKYAGGGVGTSDGMHQEDAEACGVDDTAMEHDMQVVAPATGGSLSFDARHQMHTYGNMADDKHAMMEQRRTEENIALSGKVRELTQMLSAALDAGTSETRHSCLNRASHSPWSERTERKGPVELLRFRFSALTSISLRTPCAQQRCPRASFSRDVETPIAHRSPGG